MMVFRLTVFLSCMLALFGLALATAEQPPTLTATPNRPRTEITLNIPVYIQLLTPILTIAGCVAAVGRKMGRIELLLSQHDERLKKLEDNKVEKEVCVKEHDQMERRMVLIEQDVREARG